MDYTVAKSQTRLSAFHVHFLSVIILLSPMCMNQTLSYACVVIQLY